MKRRNNALCTWLCILRAERLRRMGPASCWFLCVLALLLALSGCSFNDPMAERPPATGGPQYIEPNPDASGEGWFTASMYYRYLDEPTLAAEAKKCAYRHLQSVLDAWMEGPEENQSLTPLLPDKTELRSVELRGTQAIVTFSKEFYNVLSYAPNRWQEDASWVERVNLQHRLCIQALVNTLTESGLCFSVQILVENPSTGQPEKPLLASLGFPVDADNINETLGVRYRDTSQVLTPARTLSLILDASGTRNAAALYPYLALRDSSGEKRPSEEQISLLLQSMDTLTATVDHSTAVVSPQGDVATVSCNLHFITKTGENRDETIVPVRLIKEDGLWKIELPTLLTILGIL